MSDNSKTNASKACLVTGVGWGTGAAITRRFAAGGYQVAMLARNAERLKKLEAEVSGAHAFPCDVTDGDALHATVAEVTAKLGAPQVVVHNAVGGAFGEFTEIEPAVLERNFAVNTLALLRLGQLVTPAMVERGSGSIVCTGNTAAYRGKPHVRRLRPHQGGAAHLGGVHGAHLGAEGRTRRLCRHRRRHRLALDAATLAGGAGRVLLQAGRHRRRSVALGAPAEERMELRRDHSTVRREVVNRAKPLPNVAGR